MIDLSQMKPDYRVYGDVGFDLYILQRNSQGFMKPEAIEGITQDYNLGNLAVFSGEMTQRDIQFKRRYAPSVTRHQYTQDVIYKGTIDRDGNIKGEYEVQTGRPSIDCKGTFTMQPVKQEVVSQ